MKIGILTFHYVHNFGAVLQAYGLLEYIKSLGHECHIIDYRNSQMNKFWNSPFWWYLPIKGLSFVKKVRRVIGNLCRLPNFFLFPIKAVRKKIFNSFAIRRLNLSNVSEEFDICVYGSDQIWGLNHINNDMIFLGSDLINAKKRIAYAASSGATEQEIIDNRKICSYLTNFDFISVREKSFYEKLSKAGVYSTLVLDPSLLCDERAFSKIANRPKVNSKYLFCYRALVSNLFPKVATKLSEQMHIKTIEIRCSSNSDTVKEIFSPKRYRQFATPEEFLGYIQNAECILTTSFHGVAFSIVFRKSFYFVSSGNKAENRITSLLEQLGLTDRIIPEGEVPEFRTIDYKSHQSDGTSVEQKLFALREYSQNWLKEALNNE